MTEAECRAADCDPSRVLTPTWVVAYLALFFIWVHIHLPWWLSHSLVIDVPFFLVAARALWRAGGLRAVKTTLIGNVIPARRSLPGAALLLALMPVAFYPIGWMHQGMVSRPGLELNVVTPIHEELIYRGFILSAVLWNASARRWMMVLLSALVFASVHGSAEWWRLVMLIGLGLILGYAFVLTRSVPFCILCHAFWNAMACFPFMVHPGQ